MQINTRRIVFTSVDYAVINVLLTFQSCISWIAQTIEAIDNCNKDRSVSELTTECSILQK